MPVLIQRNTCALQNHSLLTLFSVKPYTPALRFSQITLADPVIGSKIA